MAGGGGTPPYVLIYLFQAGRENKKPDYYSFEGVFFGHSNSLSYELIHIKINVYILKKKFYSE